MTLSAHDRLAQDRLSPRIVQLWLALQGLKSVASFMQSGAHPDDETSRMLAALRFRDGLSTSYACSTRGEGGQNDLGTEAGIDLGVLRTAEMERACERLDMRMWWLSASPSDPITDFGFSKSGVETLRKWGRDRTLTQFVRIVRTERPDMLCPTFLNVPGQHGHHRAMTEAAGLVMEAAADPSFKGCDLPVWQISKLYLPGWGGGGGSYDDELSPPPATVTVSGRGLDPITGWSWGRIGEHSRMFHATQGMGHWRLSDHESDWPLHLAASHVGSDQNSVTDNLPSNFVDLGLADVAEAVSEAIALFPDTAAVISCAIRALRLIRAADGKVVPEHHHRLARKEAELARVIRFASEGSVHGWLDQDSLRPGELTTAAIDHIPAAHGKSSASLVLPQTWWQVKDKVGPNADCPPSDPYPMSWDPLFPTAPAISFKVDLDGVEAESFVPLEQDPQVLPSHSATLKPDKILVNLESIPDQFEVTIEGTYPETAKPLFELPKTWQQVWDNGRCHLTSTGQLTAGLIEAPLTLDSNPAVTIRGIAYPHIGSRINYKPATLRIRAASVAIPNATVGYIGGGNDRVANWLAAMGVRLILLEGDLDSASLLDSIDSLVVGVFAFRTRPGLAELAPKIKEWVENGGTLTTLYHRPRDNWDVEATPPRRIEIGSPSLRWRVTDENAEVRHLEPDHPVLTGPNPIGPDDWAGWVKERGLYFAKSWASDYVPLLEMADPEEQPHRGALLSADIGKGRHNHVALGLHVQMDNLVPGAFRIMANLLAVRS